MLNLQDIQNKTIDIIWIDGQLVKLNQPTLKMMLNLGTCGEDLNKMQDAIVVIMNNNSSNRKFTRKDLDTLSQAGLQALVEEITGAKKETEEHPNA